MQPKIVHVALKVENLEKASEFYEKILGFYHTGSSRKSKTNSHTSRHLSDGSFDLALMQYDSEDAPDAQLAGRGPRIHHIGIQVDDPLSYVEKLRAAGCEILSTPGEIPVKFAEGPEILSAPGEIPVKFRDPSGILVEVGRFNAYIKPRPAV